MHCVLDVRFFYAQDKSMIKFSSMPVFSLFIEASQFICNQEKCAKVHVVLLDGNWTGNEKSNLPQPGILFCYSVHQKMNCWTIK